MVEIKDRKLRDMVKMLKEGELAIFLTQFQRWLTRDYDWTYPLPFAEICSGVDQKTQVSVMSKFIVIAFEKVGKGDTEILLSFLKSQYSTEEQKRLIPVVMAHKMYRLENPGIAESFSVILDFMDLLENLEKGL